MKKTFLVLFFELLILSLTAQYSLTGEVVTSENKAIGYATVAIFPLSDSTNVFGEITSEKGMFEFNDLIAGEYKLVVQMLGYDDWEKELKINSDTPLGKIILKEETNILNAVEVVAEWSYLQSRLGKKVLIIGQDLASTGSSALEAMEQIPSVTTIQRGGIQIRSSSNVVIYVNGKETKRDAASLKAVGADVLEKIEVVTNPSAEYDAEGIAGIINLVYKKEKNAKLKLEGVFNFSVHTRIYIAQLYGDGFRIEKKDKWQTRRVSIGLRYVIFNG